jgi:hypothetical protein
MLNYEDFQCIEKKTPALKSKTNFFMLECSRKDDVAGAITNEF